MLKQPMISIEFWGKFTKCSTTDCFNTIGYIPTRHQTDLSKPCKLTCASLIMSKKAMPLLYPPKKGMRKFERYLWETSLFVQQKNRAPSDCASRGNLLYNESAFLLNTLSLLGKSRLQILLEQNPIFPNVYNVGSPPKTNVFGTPVGLAAGRNPFNCGCCWM